ncbi:MAG TPA: hypothetical protein VFV49_16890 [Thermoanaerobaculia bacterium]|nr:hypothetical protein [Thermoanaerobaculia bacterium]
MAEPKLRTIKIARRHASVSRREVTKAIKAVMKLRGEVPAPRQPSRKRAAASRK